MIIKKNKTSHYIPYSFIMNKVMEKHHKHNLAHLQYSDSAKNGTVLAAINASARKSLCSKKTHTKQLLTSSVHLIFFFSKALFDFVIRLCCCNNWCVCTIKARTQALLVAKTHKQRKAPYRLDDTAFWEQPGWPTAEAPEIRSSPPPSQTHSVILSLPVFFFFFVLLFFRQSTK